MKLKFLFAGAALTFAALAYSQETPALEQQIKDYTAKIENIVLAEKSKMNEELDALDKNFKNGKISETERDSQRAAIATKYEISINEKVNTEKSSLEDITQKTVKDAVMNKDKKSVLINANNTAVVTVKSGEKKTHPKDLLNDSGIVVSIGWLNLTNSDAPLNFFNNSSEIRFGQSMSSVFAIKGSRQIGNFTSPIFMNYGVGIRADSHDLGPKRVFAQDQNELFIAPFTAGEIRKSQLKVEYLEVPVDVQFILNPKYIEYDGVQYIDATKKQFRVGAGLYGDLKIGNRIKYSYSDEISKKNEFRQRAENGLNKFVYGAKLSVGYGGLNVFVKKDLNPIFDKNARMDNKHGLHIGIELASINF